MGAARLPNDVVAEPAWIATSATGLFLLGFRAKNCKARIDTCVYQPAQEVDRAADSEQERPAERVCKVIR